MPRYASKGTRERPVRAGRARRLRCARLARPVRLCLERLRKRGSSGFRCARCTDTSSSSCASRPAYGGSLVERAPFALIPQLWGGGELAVYRIGRRAVPARVSPARSLARRAHARGIAISADTGRSRSPSASPIRSRSTRLEVGHPEELLGACLCVAAVLFASDDRALLAGVLLGLAIANKPVGAARLRPGAARPARASAGRLLRRSARGSRRRARAAGARRLRRLRHRRARERRPPPLRSFSPGRSGGSSDTTALSCMARSAPPSPAIARARAGRGDQPSAGRGLRRLP